MDGPFAGIARPGNGTIVAGELAGSQCVAKPVVLHPPPAVGSAVCAAPRSANMRATTAKSVPQYQGCLRKPASLVGRQAGKCKCTREHRAAGRARVRAQSGGSCSLTAL